MFGRAEKDRSYISQARPKPPEEEYNRNITEILKYRGRISIFLLNCNGMVNVGESDLLGAEPWTHHALEVVPGHAMCLVS